MVDGVKIQSSSPQLLLPLCLDDEATFENFVTDSDADGVEWLHQWVQTGSEHCVHLWGSPGVGRSHLIHACCHLASELGLSVAAFGLANDQGLTPAMLDGLESLDLLCLDDIDAVLGQADWEEALMNLYNRSRDLGRRLLVTAVAPPMQLTLKLADLQSRLSWGLVFQLHGLSDAAKRRALQLRSQQRGVLFGDAVADYLLNHYCRDLSALFTALEVLDQAAMVSQRRLTVPFLKEVLGIQQFPS